MNELSNQTMQLPDTLEDLSKFTLIGREKLNAVRAEIRAIEKVGLAKEVHEQKLREAQEIAEAVLDAETKIGELTSKMEQGINRYSSNNGVTPKNKQLEEIGLSKMQASRFETLAKHPEAVEEAKADAREQDKIVTRQDVLNRIFAAENETKRQQEARELREAKHRVESYESGKVVAIGDARQNIEDNKLIFDEFKEKLYKARMAILQAAIALNNETIRKAVETADKRELIKENDELQECSRTIFKIQHTIQEVLDEK